MGKQAEFSQIFILYFSIAQRFNCSVEWKLFMILEIENSFSLFFAVKVLLFGTEVEKFPSERQLDEACERRHTFHLVEENSFNDFHAVFCWKLN